MIHGPQKDPRSPDFYLLKLSQVSITYFIIVTYVVKKGNNVKNYNSVTFCNSRLANKHFENTKLLNGAFFMS